ncbi:MAG: CAP domain-containing protein [Desulfotomaculaceae bacterium]
MYSLVNQDRSRNGLPPLALDMTLVNLARAKSQDMYQNNYFGHTSPTYGSAYDMEKKAGLSYSIMGAENIAKAATVQSTEQAFMNSSGHKANILNPQHNTIGIGITDTQSGVVITTQLFAKK